MNSARPAADASGTAAAYMGEALRLAALGSATTHPNPRVGCVIVREGEIVGRGFHQRAGQAHAEVLALREAGPRARGADVYLTLEPCSHFGRTPPCADALVAAGVRRVVAAMQDPNPQVAGRGFARLRGAGIETEIGPFGAEAARLNRGFISRMTRARPWLTLKMGASLDGRTAAASGESKWITGPEARADVHRLRAEAGAVMSSSATVLADDPGLDVRDYAGEPAFGLRQPDRIVLDRRGRVPPQAKVWSEAGGARRFRLLGLDAGLRAVSPPGVKSLVLKSQAGGASDAGAEIGGMLRQLAAEDINEVLLECGPTLAGAFLGACCVDELALYLAPSLLGDAARPLAHLPALLRLPQRIDWDITDLRMIGRDIRVIAVPRHL